MNYFYLIIIFIFGLCIGSFISCLIWRLHEKKTVLGRSMCPKCKHKISWYDNIPLFSFIWLQGKCRHCKKKISWQYPVVEFITGVLFIIAWYLHIDLDFSLFTVHSLLLFRDWIFIFILVIIFIYDLRWYLILDIITVPAMIIALAFNLYLGYSWQNLLLAVVIGGGFFLLQYIASRGKWIGGGDVRLGVLMGLMLGYPNIIISLMLAYIFGSIIGIMLLIIGKKKMSSEIPFGTFLSIATIITLFWGVEISGWYLSLIY